MRVFLNIVVSFLVRWASFICLVSCVLFFLGDVVSRGLQGGERRNGSSTRVYYMDKIGYVS